ncbi:hypothetical protein H257_15172 [Aphanomyces astaci]|uniref:Uncharacterized protein n=1 Tax=Aphanomyces astaci TaxID=112090 RepID=W4FQC6_APHAT|nr:hypothetical protein H257_15172 [Aphanomyces astaci]ETV69019.1 hypothetical protein H257_15172 [Aphanomyces astaci]|eukprot:XP_009841478.1 hypothetical protein H257_15172 [Aphanomyces astaci]
MRRAATSPTSSSSSPVTDDHPMATNATNVQKSKHDHTRQASILSMRRYYAKNRDKELLRFKEYYQKNKDRIRAYKKRAREQTKRVDKAEATQSSPPHRNHHLHDLLSPAEMTHTTHGSSPQAKLTMSFLLN